MIDLVKTRAPDLPSAAMLPEPACAPRGTAARLAIAEQEGGEVVAADLRGRRRRQFLRTGRATASTSSRLMLMARFYFHLNDRGAWMHDGEGMDLPDREAAIEHARKEARAIIAADILSGAAIRLNNSLAIEDEDQNIVGEVLFRSVISFDDSRATAEPPG